MGTIVIKDHIELQRCQRGQAVGLWSEVLSELQAEKQGGKLRGNTPNIFLLLPSDLLFVFVVD